MEEDLKDRFLDWLSKELKRSFETVCDHDMEMQKIQREADASLDAVRLSLSEHEEAKRLLLRYADSRDALEFARARHGFVFGAALLMLLFQDMEHI